MRHRLLGLAGFGCNTYCNSIRLMLAEKGSLTPPLTLLGRKGVTFSPLGELSFKPISFKVEIRSVSKFSISAYKMIYIDFFMS